jgi:hypothetical protein
MQNATALLARGYDLMVARRTLQDKLQSGVAVMYTDIHQTSTLNMYYCYQIAGHRRCSKLPSELQRT